MNKFVAIAPCIYMETTSYDQYHDGIGYYRKLGINVIYGPNWDDHVVDICANMSESWCNNAKNGSGEPEPTKTREWYYQNAVEQSYSQYDFTYEDERALYPLIDPGLDSIDKVPLHFIVGENDTHCSLEHA
jgi:hypothetical protein